MRFPTSNFLQKLESGDRVISDEEIQLIISLLKKNERFEESFNNIAKGIVDLKHSFFIDGDATSSDLNADTLPDIGIQLETVLKQTDEATDSILNNCDVITEQADKISSEGSKAIKEAVTHIFEASNFHDLINQRIKKVLNLLQKIEDQVKTILPQNMAPKKEATAKPDGAEEELTLNGPEVNPPSQEEIDQLFGNN